jgi:hypothetical protein
LPETAFGIARAGLVGLWDSLGIARRVSPQAVSHTRKPFVGATGSVGISSWLLPAILEHVHPCPSPRRNLFLATDSARVAMIGVMSTTRRYLAFDIESARITDNASDWKSQRPLGISCAATLLADADQLTLWHGGTDRSSPKDRMSQEEATKLVTYLTAQTEAGCTILTWNGLGFDFDVLAEESGMLDQCRCLAASHVDMMFDIFCRLGHGVGLDAAARGMGVAGKPEGMKGEMAPVLWAKGRREEVLKYVAQDVRTTLELATACQACGELRWVSRSGMRRSMPLPEGWLAVSEALELPLPDTSWMDDPWSRERFTAWMG